MFLVADPHWKPQTELTPFCSLKYSNIITVEELGNELPTLLRYLKLNMFIDSTISINGHQTGSNTETEAAYMNQLSDVQKHLLFEKVYKTDYTLFQKFYSYKWFNTS